MEPHHRRCYMPSAPLLGRPVSSPCMHAGVLVGPGRERRATSSAPARRLTRQDAGPYTPGSAAGQKEDEATKGSRRTSRPGPEMGIACGRQTPPPYLDPSFSNTAPPSRTPQHDEDTRPPVYFGHFIPFGHCFIISVE